MSAGIIGFALGAFAGGVMGVSVAALVSAGTHHDDLVTMARQKAVLLSVTQERHDAATKASGLEELGRDMLEQIEEDDLVLGTSRAVHYRNRMAKLGIEAV